MADDYLQSAIAELQRRGVKVAPNGQPAAGPSTGLPAEADQGIRPLQRALQVKQLRGAIDTQDAVNELKRRGVNVQLANADIRDKATIAKEKEEAEYIIGSLDPDPVTRAQTLAKKQARDLEKAYSEAIGDLPENFQDVQGITPATFEDWFKSSVQPRIDERVNAFQGSDAQRAQFANQLQEQAQNNPNLQEQYRMYAVEAKNRPAIIERGTPQYYDKLRSDLTERLQANAVKAAQVKAIPGILESQAKAQAERPAKVQEQAKSIRGEVQDNKVVELARLKLNAVDQVRSLADKPNPTNQDDLALIYAFVRALDPASAVREGEVSLLKQGRGIPNTVISAWNNIVGNPNAVLTPDIRKGLRGLADTEEKTAQRAIAPELKRYYTAARAQGLPLNEIFSDVELDSIVGSAFDSLGADAVPAGTKPAASANSAAPAAKPASPAKATSGGSIRIQNGYRYQQGADGNWTPIGPV